MNSVPAQADPQLRAVRAVLDPQQVSAALDAWFTAAGRDERVETLTVQRLFYVPGGDCHLVYAATLRRGGERHAAMLSGSVTNADDAAVALGKAERKVAKGKFVQPAVGAPVYHLAELGLVLWTFPNDPKLKSLPAQAEGPAESALAAVLPPAPERRIGAARRTVVRYIPRKRCVLRWEIDWCAPDGTGADRQVVYAKVYEDGAPARAAQDVLEALWTASLGDRRMLRVPEPVGYDADTWTAFQRAVPGAPLVQEAAHITPWQMSSIGRGLAAMHLVRAPVRAVHSLDDEMAKLRAHAALVARVHPEAGPDLEAIVGTCAALLPRLPRLPLVPSHGTFKLAHLLHDGSRMTLVDFDSFVQADPAYDVANCASDLHYLEANGMLPAGRALRLAAALHDAWCAHVPWGRRDVVLNWMVASLLVRKQALKCVKHLHADAPAKVRRVLADARRRLGEESP